MLRTGFGGAYETHSDGTIRKYYSFAGQTVAMRIIDTSHPTPGTLTYFLTDHTSTGSAQASARPWPYWTPAGRCSASKDTYPSSPCARTWAQSPNPTSAIPFKRFNQKLFSEQETSLRKYFMSAALSGLWVFLISVGGILAAGSVYKGYGWTTCEAIWIAVL